MVCSDLLITTVSVTLVVLQIESGYTNENELLQAISYSCPGDKFEVECAIAGGGATVWQGSVFNGCQNNKTILRHSEFIPGAVVNQTCSTRQPIVVYAISANRSYISRLIVGVSEDLSGRTIECGNSEGIIIVRKLISVVSNLLPPPSNITLSDINKDTMTFTWDEMNTHDVTYNIHTSRCGTCPNTTTFNYITCRMNHNHTTQLHTCTFAIQTVVCGMAGILSDMLTITVGVPEPPTFHLLQSFDSFPIFVMVVNTPDFDVPPSDANILVSNYTIIYSDSLSGGICDTATLPVSSCGRRICSSVFDVYSSQCFNYSSINVTVFATNSFGDGQVSQPIIATIQTVHLEERTDRYDYPACQSLLLITSIPIGAGMLVILLLFCAVFIIVTIILVKHKARIQKELASVKESLENKPRYHEEINSFPLASVAPIRTDNNAAYSCISRVCASTTAT